MKYTTTLAILSLILAISILIFNIYNAWKVASK